MRYTDWLAPFSQLVLLTRVPSVGLGVLVEQQGESMYIGMKKVTPEEYKAYQANLAKTGGLDPLEASRQKAKEAIQTASQKK